MQPLLAEHGRLLTYGFKVVSALAAITSMTACFPISHTFYRPAEPPSQNASITGCIFPGTLIFSRHGVKFNLGTYEHQEQVIKHGGILYATLTLVIPRGEAVKLRVEDLRAVSSSKQRIGGVNVGRNSGVWVRDWTHPDKPDIALVPPPTKFTANEYVTSQVSTAWYTIEFGIDLSTPAVDTFVVVVPEMEINGLGYPPLKVKFKKTSEINWVPINGC